MKDIPKGPNVGTPYAKEAPGTGALADNARLVYIMKRAHDRSTRFQRQRERRVRGWDLDMMQNYPIQGLQRELTELVERFDESCYGIVSQHYCETLPDRHPLARYWGLTFYRVEVFYHLEPMKTDGDNGTDPCVARVECLTARGLRNRLSVALANLGPHAKLVDSLVAGEGWEEHLLALMLDPGTTSARTEVFQKLLKRLTVGEAQQLSEMLTQGVTSHLPGTPGYAALHGLYGPQIKD